MEIKENKEKAMIELDNVKKDIEKQRAILASFTSYANDQARRREGTPSPQAAVTPGSYTNRSNPQMRPGMPQSQTSSMSLPDLINHEASGAEAGCHPSQGRMMMPHNGMYGARHRPGAPGHPLPPTLQGPQVNSHHHHQAQMPHRVHQTPAQFQNTNIHHFLPHHDPRQHQFPQHIAPQPPQSSPMPRVQRNSPVTIAPMTMSQTQTSSSVQRSISHPEVRRPSSGSTPDSQVPMIRPKAFCRETSPKQPPADVRGQHPPTPVTDPRRSEVATRGSAGGHLGPTSVNNHSRSHHNTITRTANIPLHARPAYFSR